MLWPAQIDTKYNATNTKGWGGTIEIQMNDYLYLSGWIGSGLSKFGSCFEPAGNYGLEPDQIFSLRTIWDN